MNRVTICENLLDPNSWIPKETEDVCALLKQHFGTWPSTARIYHKYVAESADVTPVDEASAKRLESLSGEFYVVVYPAEPTTIFIIVAIAIGAIAVGLSFLLRPSTPNVKNQQNQSANNELSSRQNKERPNERIPDIYGRLWSTPDLVQVPYRIFAAGVEIEYSLMCIGRGSYTISEVRDDLTPVQQVTGTSVEVYGPFTSPNGGTPQLSIGAAIGEPVRTIKPCTSVNGQILVAPNLPGGGAWIGPFILGDVSTTEVWVNFTAEAGSYSIPSGTGVQAAQNVDLRLEVTPVDGAGVPTGAAVNHDVTLNGSATLKDRIGVTLKVAGLTGIVSIRAKRLTNTIIAANTSVSDEIKWRDAMSISPVAATNFGDVTLVQTKSLPTPQALALKQRKLNMLVTRNVITGVLAAGVVTRSAEVGPSLDAADIAVAIALDPLIGNRTLAEIDLVGIYTALADAETYFGTDLVRRFCYTFDNASVSFEEMLADIATSCFCVSYRRGSVLSFLFEKQTDDSTLLFNHRNKLPGTETRTVTFGTINDIDGIELQYIEPNAPNFPNQDTPVTIYLPADRSAINPRKVDSVGIRNNVQAYMIAHRLYNKLKFQHVVTQFDATKEAAVCIRQERILVADNTRPDTQDGEVIAQVALLLTLSQDIKFLSGRTYTIFLQHPDKTVEAIVVTAGPNANQVVLAGAPSVPCVVDVTKYARTTYIIVDDSPQRGSAFLLEEKTPKDGGTYELKATNYDDRFYANDGDFIANIVVWNGDEGFAGTPIAPGTTYYASIVNDLGNNPATYDDVSGTVEAEYDPAVPYPSGVPTFLAGDVIWEGFPAISLTGVAHLYITVDSASADVPCNYEVRLNGVSVLSGSAAYGPNTLSVAIPAGTFLNTCKVEVIARPGFGGPVPKFASISVSAIQIT